jgi:MFS family permease
MLDAGDSLRAENGEPAAGPSRARLIVLLFLCLLATVLYLDRICISQALEPMQAELGLSNSQAANILMAFTLAYGVFEVPSGWWGDRIGARAVLTRIALWWSLFTGLTGACTGYGSLIIVRFLFGAGEAGAFPNSARVLARWFPDHERGRAQAVLLTASQVGAVAAPTCAAYLIEIVGWRWTFAVFGTTGVVWSAAFWTWFRDDPTRHPAVNAAELQHIGAARGRAESRHGRIPWRAVLTNPGIWVLGVIMTCAAFNSYLYYSWFAKYLMSGRDVDNRTAGWLTSLVLAGAGAGMLSGGVLVDRIVARGDEDRRRRWFGSAAYGAAALALWLAVQCDTAWGLAVLASLSCLCMSSTLPMWWSCAIGISGRHVGALFGLMNMMGVVGAMASQAFVGHYTDWRGRLGDTGRAQWDPLFAVFVGMLLVGSACWSVYRSRPVHDDEGDHELGEATSGDASSED